MNYKCKCGFITMDGERYSYDDVISEGKYNTLRLIEQRNFNKIDEYKHREDTIIDSITYINEPSQSNDAPDTFGGFGGGSFGGGGSSGSWSSSDSSSSDSGGGSSD